MKVYCIKEYKTEIDILDLPKIDHTAFKIGHFYNMDMIETIEGDDDDGYYITGEDDVFVVFGKGALDEHFIYGISNIRNHKLDMIGI